MLTRFFHDRAFQGPIDRVDLVHQGYVERCLQSPHDGNFQPVAATNQSMPVQADSKASWFGSGQIRFPRQS